MTDIDDITTIEAEARAPLGDAADAGALDAWASGVFGNAGALTAVLRSLGGPMRIELRTKRSLV